MRASVGVSNGLWRLCITISAVVTAFLLPSSVVGQTKNPSANTISGTVRIFDRGGDEFKDRSGVVVFVDALPRAAQPHDLQNEPRISHKGRQFSPGVLPIVKGTTINFFNDDSIYHNVFSLSKSNTFDLGIYPEGTSKFVTFSELGLVKIHCNIHPRMSSTILVLNNTLFAKTGPDGRFRIDGVPDGQHRLRLWSELSDEQSRNVSVSGGGRFEESFEVRVTKRFIQHKNKFGKRYREKY